MILVLALFLLAIPPFAHGTKSYALELDDGTKVYQHTHFLGIGVDYKSQGKDDRFAAAVNGLRRALEDNCSQEPDQERLLLEGRATAPAVIEALRQLANPKQVGPEDRVIVDVVCHGDDSRTPTFLLAPDSSTRAHSTLSMATLRRLFLAIPARHKLLIVDGCKAGALLKGQGVGSFDGLEEVKSTLKKRCAVIWSSTQSGANTISEPGGTFFHNHLTKVIRDDIRFGQTTRLRQVVVEVERAGAPSPCRSFGPPDVDLIVAGPESKQAPPIDPKQGRLEPSSEDVDEAKRSRWELEGKIKAKVKPDEAELLRRSLLALQHYKTVDIAPELDYALKEGDRALVVFSWADHPDEFLEIHRSLAYLCMAVGQWKPDIALLKTALAHRKTVLDKLVEGDRGSKGKDGVGGVALAPDLLALADTEESAGKLGDDAALRDAPVRYRKALAIYTRDRDPAVWAMIQNNMAIAWETLGEQGDINALKEAVDGCKHVLEVYTRDTNPGNWALTQNNLAIALEILGEREGNQNLNESIDHFKQALEVWTRETYPAEWAMAQNNLGNAMRILGERGDVNALKESIEHSRQALEVRTRALDPANWATTQNNLANALRVLGERGDVNALKEAVERYKQALEVRTRVTAPAEWAMTQNNLAGALVRLGERDDINALKEATDHFNHVLEVYTRDMDPARWAMTQSNLGSALVRLGERGDINALKEAVGCYKLALDVYTREMDPSHWAGTQNNLAGALLRQGEYGDVNALKEAVEHFKLALEVYTRDTNPANWAMTQNNLAIALEILGERGNISALKEAVDCYKLVLEVRNINTDPAGYAQSELGLGNTFKALGEKAEAAQALQAAAQAYRSIGQSELADKLEQEAKSLK